MKNRNLIAFGVAACMGVSTQVYAQVKMQAAPSGQVPKAYTGVTSGQGAVVQPKPTGQIAPEAPGQLGNIYQPPVQQAAPTQKAAAEQDLGFEVNSRPTATEQSSNAQQGMVPKVTTSQDPRTMTERYQPNAPKQQQQTMTPEQAQQVLQQLQTQSAANGQQLPATQAQSGSIRATQATPAQGQAAPAQQMPSRVQSGSSTQQSAYPGAAPAKSTP